MTYLISTRAGSLEWCLWTIEKNFVWSTMNYYWRNWRHMASRIRSLNGFGHIWLEGMSSSPEWKGVKWGADETWNSSGKYFRPTILHTIHQRSTSACQFTSRPLCWWLIELKLSLNISANEICHWADSNKLRINKSKAKVLTITRKCLASNINDELVVHSNLLSQHANCVRFLHAIARLTVRCVQFTRNQAITIH